MVGWGKGPDSAELGETTRGSEWMEDREARWERGPEGFVGNLREREGEGPWCLSPFSGRRSHRN